MLADFDTSLFFNMFPAPLEIEEEDTSSGTFRFLQMWNKMSPTGDTVVVGHYHKNTHRIAEGKPPLKNMVPYHSHAAPQDQWGRLTGALHSVLYHTAEPTLLADGTMQTLLAFKQFGLPRHKGVTALHLMARKTGNPTYTDLIPAFHQSYRLA